MARKNNAAATSEVTEETSVSPAKVTAPEGFEEVTVDLEATYDYRLTPEVFVSPLGYTVSDSKDKKKPSILIHCNLEKPAMLVPMGEDSDSEGSPIREFPAGTRIGVWYRPGLRTLMQCAGSVTFLAFVGDKDVGQILPMKTFMVAREKGSRASDVPLIADHRKMTRHKPLPWENAEDLQQSRRALTANATAAAGAPDDDDIPF